MTGPRSAEGVDGVRAYKDVIGELDRAAVTLRGQDDRRAEALRRRLDELAVAAADAERAAALARLAAELAWDRVVDRLWHESWMTLRPHPRPAPEADPEDLDALVVGVEQAADAVLDAVRRRSFGFGGR